MANTHNEWITIRKKNENAACSSSLQHMEIDIDKIDSIMKYMCFQF